MPVNPQPQPYNCFIQNMYRSAPLIYLRTNRPIKSLSNCFKLVIKLKSIRKSLTSSNISHKLKCKILNVLPTGLLMWKKSKDLIGLDAKALLLQHFEYLSQFSQTKQGSRRFQIYANDG